jgi:hypothetical protein
VLRHAGLVVVPGLCAFHEEMSASGLNQLGSSRVQTRSPMRSGRVVGRLPPPRNGRYRGYSGGRTALEPPCSRAACCVDASGRRYLVELLRVTGRRFGGGENLSHGVREAHSCDGKERRAKRMADAYCPAQISQLQHKTDPERRGV